MRIKHWQGYGLVNAVKVKDDSCTLHVKVTGDHEQGLEREDAYDLYNWLVKKFDKSVPSSMYQCTSFGYKMQVNDWNDVDYYFYYKV